MSILTTKELTKQYANHLALNKVSISVSENKIFGLLGPNGAGKTSLIRIINQITAPDSGEVTLFDKPISRKDIGLIGYLPEERGLYKKMKVAEHILYLAQLKGVSKADAIKRVQYWFKKFEIEAWHAKTIDELSKGMQQKVQFVGTIIHQPKLLILDEPFSGFDPINALMLKEEILNLKSTGTTIILSTHNMASVEEICDDIALINKGVVLLSGSVKEVRESYKNNLLKIEIQGSTELKESLEKLFPDASIENAPNSVLAFSTQLANGESPNTIISKLLPLGTIVSINEQLPTMNDIFINSVNQHNHTK